MSAYICFAHGILDLEGVRELPRPVNIASLRKKALRQLSERLNDGSMATADLIRLVGMKEIEQDGGNYARAVDWVLQLAPDDTAPEEPEEKKDA